MLVPILILVAGVIAFGILYRNISRNQVAEINSLAVRKQRLKDKYEFLRNRKKELLREIEEKRNQFATLQNNMEGIRTYSAEELDITEDNDSEKISRYLIQEGKITLEQNLKVLEKMEVLQMDYLGVCMALGIIDLATAKRALKINKISSKSISSS